MKPWRGRVTKTVYWFGSERQIGYVDARDAVKFLTPVRAGGAMPVFRVWQQDYESQPSE